MAVALEFINLIIPIARIDQVWPGGFAAYKAGHERFFGLRLWHDEHLFRDGAMSPLDMQSLVGEWTRRGLVGKTEKNSVLVWQDLCVVDQLSACPTLPCDWLEGSRADRCVWLKGQPQGELAGPWQRGVT
jgi:hypothetical protein